jgi:hypothetical protein
MNDDPLTPLAEAAVQMHELVLIYERAGFTRAESIQIVVALMVAKMGENSG